MNKCKHIRIKGKYKGTQCNYKSKFNGYCGHHKKFAKNKILEKKENICTDNKIYDIKSISDNKISHIFHISDIHIPDDLHLNNKKEHFQNVFTMLYNKLNHLKKRYPNIVTVITGDLIDKKLYIKPNTYLFSRIFLKNLLKICPLILIPGNHDFIEKNETLLDSITAISDDIHDLHYLKYSGIYKYGDFFFITSSLIDKKFIRIENCPKLNGKTIYLYHGTLSGSSLFNGSNLVNDFNNGSTRFRSIKDFNGFDLVLLGDIHKHQYLKNNIAYPSSLVQLNFGETYHNHGGILWNINNSESTFIPFKSDYGYVNINVNDGNIRNIDDIFIPKYPKFRCLLHNTSTKQFENIALQLKNKYNAISVVAKHKSVHNFNNNLELKFDSVVSIEDELKLIDKFIKCDKFCNKIKKYHIDITNIVNYSNPFPKIWNIISIEFKNFFIFGNNNINKINFQTGINNINSLNATGKTSIVNIILYMLFDKITQVKCKSDIINISSNKAFCNLLFECSGKQYLINKTIRKSSGKKKTCTYNTFLFKISNGGNKINLT